MNEQARRRCGAWLNVGIGQLPVLAALLCGGGLALAHEREGQALPGHDFQEGAVAGSLHLAWESRYSSEGRDNLDGDSIWVQSLEYCWRDLCFGVWRAESPEQPYEELQLAMAYGWRWGDLELSLGYTHLRFPEDDEHDHEVGLGLVWDGGPFGIEWALDAYHSHEASGSFIEATAGRTWDWSETSSVGLAVIFGVNQGYVADGHDGANHAAMQLTFRHAISDALALTVHGTWSQALERNRDLAGDESLRDFLHAGMGLEWNF